MNKAFTKFKHNATLLAGIFIALIPAVGQADWSFTGLGDLGGGRSVAFGINDSGQVVGASETSDETQHAFITGPNGVGMSDLGNLSSYATGINNSGQVIGIAGTSNELFYPFITGPNGVGMTSLGLLGGADSFTTTGINNSGQVAGWHFTNNGNFNAFMTGPNGIGITDLDALGGGFGKANGINNFGQVVGSSRNIDGDHHVFMTGPNGVGITDLGITGTAAGINDSGQVVGDVFNPSNGLSRAFVTDPNGVGMTDLGTLGGNQSFAYAINDSGEVVGAGLIGDFNGSSHAFLFSHGGMTDLSLLDVVVAAGWTNISVIDINNNGQMVGEGLDSTGHSQAFLLSYTPDTVFDPQPIFIPSPIPEPETYAMLLVGLGLIGFMARRRKAATA